MIFKGSKLDGGHREGEEGGEPRRRPVVRVGGEGEDLQEESVDHPSRKRSGRRVGTSEDGSTSNAGEQNLDEVVMKKIKILVYFVKNQCYLRLVP